MKRLGGSTWCLTSARRPTCHTVSTRWHGVCAVCTQDPLQCTYFMVPTIQDPWLERELSSLLVSSSSPQPHRYSSDIADFCATASWLNGKYDGEVRLGCWHRLLAANSCTGCQQCRGPGCCPAFSLEQPIERSQDFVWERRGRNSGLPVQGAQGAPEPGDESAKNVHNVQCSVFNATKWLLFKVWEIPETKHFLVNIITTNQKFPGSLTMQYACISLQNRYRCISNINSNSLKPMEKNISRVYTVQ